MTNIGIHGFIYGVRIRYMVMGASLSVSLSVSLPLFLSVTVSVAVSLPQVVSRC